MNILVDFPYIVTFWLTELLVIPKRSIAFVIAKSSIDSLAIGGVLLSNEERKREVLVVYGFERFWFGLGQYLYCLAL